MNNTCTYIGEHMQGCTHASLEGKSYCQEHYARVYQVGSGLRKRHKDMRHAAQVWDLESMFNEIILELEQESLYD